MILTLAAEGVTASKPELAADVLAAQEYFSGDWYGWWRIENSTGDLPDSWYDCFAAIESEEDGSSLLTVWDESSSREEPMGQAALRFSREGDDPVAESSVGWFWFEEIGSGEWTIRPAETDFADTILLVGQHDAEGERFDYTILLRPWGTLWDDMEEDDLPYYYEEWYLPRREDPMPGSLELPE